MTLFCDLDGTLIDSAGRHTALLRDILDSRGEGRALDDYMRFKADGGSTRAYLLGLGLSEDQAANAAEQWRQHIEDDRYLLMDRRYDDAVPFLSRYAPVCRIVYVTARRRREALLETLERLELASFAAEVFVVDPAKAAEEKAVAVGRLAGPADVFIGDTEADMECARQAGVDWLMLDRGFRSAGFWRGKGVDSFGSLTAMYMILDKKVGWGI